MIYLFLTLLIAASAVIAWFLWSDTAQWIDWWLEERKRL